MKIYVQVPDIVIGSRAVVIYRGVLLWVHVCCGLPSSCMLGQSHRFRDKPRETCMPELMAPNICSSADVLPLVLIQGPAWPPSPNASQHDQRSHIVLDSCRRSRTVASRCLRLSAWLLNTVRLARALWRTCSTTSPTPPLCRLPPTASACPTQRRSKCFI